MEEKRARGGAGSFLLAAALAAFFAAGCATQGPAPDIPQATYDPLLLQQLEGKTWVLSGILFDGAFIPMEPAHSAGNVLVFNKDGTFRTTAARLVMSGTWRLAPPRGGGEASPDAAIAMKRTSIEGEREEDPDADRFQEAYLSAFEEAAELSAYGNSFMLYDAGGRHILSFILNNPAW